MARPCFVLLFSLSFFGCASVNTAPASCEDNGEEMRPLDPTHVSSLLLKGDIHALDN